jgi:hypothetical protein
MAVWNTPVAVPTGSQDVKYCGVKETTARNSTVSTVRVT